VGRGEASVSVAVFDLFFVGYEGQVVEANLRGIVRGGGLQQNSWHLEVPFRISILLALRMKDSFDKYVFCEEKPANINAFKDSGSEDCSRRRRRLR